MEISRAQESIYKYLQTQYDFTGQGGEGYPGLSPVGDYGIMVHDMDGEASLGMNFFGDIINETTGNVIAVSDLPHDLGRAGLRMPGCWDNTEDFDLPGPLRPGRPAASEIAENMQDIIENVRSIAGGMAETVSDRIFSRDSSADIDI